MNKEQKKSIRKFERWQDRKFASNAKKGYRFFQPDSVDVPTPRTAREAWGSDYKKEDDDRRQERYIDWFIGAIIVIYIAFLVWKEFP
jgi:hypothetical protein